MTLHVDFETRSELSLPDVGAYAYAQHPSTRVLCMAWAQDDGRVFSTFNPDFMRGVLNTSSPLRSFNATFERLIAKHCLGKATSPQAWRCTAAQARSNAYPGNLEDCARALQLTETKDLEGYALMRQLSNGANAEPTQAELDRLAQYCRTDVEVERKIGQMTRELPLNEWEDYWLNEEINDRGVLIDTAFCRAASAYAQAERSELNIQINAASLGEITSVTQTKRIAQLLGLLSISREAVEDLLDSPDALNDFQRTILELRQQGANTTTSKFAKMLEMVDAHDRLCGMFLFAGAGQTGRYSSKGVQVHNLARAVPKLYLEMMADIRRGMDPRGFKLVYGNVIHHLSRLVRPTLIASKGRQFFIADFKGVEARGLPWIANAHVEVKAYADGRDRYVEDAREIYGSQHVTPEMRQIGKVARLSLGFGGGVNAFAAMAKNYGVKVDPAHALKIVQGWRKANPWATAFWNELHTAAVHATRKPGHRFTCGKLSYLAHNGSLWCRLPSSRVICYPQVSATMDEGPFASFQLSAMKAQWKPAQGQVEWPRVNLWPGLVTENADQATCNDLLRFSMRTVTAAGYAIVTHSHDELVVEVDADSDVEHFKQSVERRPPWAEDFPLVADVHVSKRYVKND